MTFKWTVKNSKIRGAWPKKMELVPIMNKPKMRMLFASNIFPL